MLYELIRTIVQKILQDKILFGLVIVAFLGIFVGGMTMGDDKDSKSQKRAQDAVTGGNEPLPAAETPAQAPAGQPQGAAPTAAATAQPVSGQLACDFVTWWLTSAMDYNAQTAQASHNQAMSWMTPDAQAVYQQNFWSPQISEAVTSGRLIAAFQPTGVQAQAINPDGSVVVGVSGQMIVQSGGQPAPQQFLASFLVKHDHDGMRIGGVNAQTRVLP